MEDGLCWFNERQGAADLRISVAACRDRLPRCGWRSRSQRCGSPRGEGVVHAAAARGHLREGDQVPRRSGPGRAQRRPQLRPALRPADAGGRGALEAGRARPGGDAAAVRPVDRDDRPATGGCLRRPRGAGAAARRALQPHRAQFFDALPNHAAGALGVGRAGDVLHGTAEPDAADRGGLPQLPAACAGRGHEHPAALSALRQDSVVSGVREGPSNAGDPARGGGGDRHQVLLRG